jgi:hypothetical protein
MTTYYQFIPSRVSAPVFTPTLDGNQYTVSVTWNTSARRYYINVITMSGILIASVPLIESPASMAVSNAIWDPQNMRVVLTTVNPHPFIIGAPAKAFINGMSPDNYNGSGFILPLSKTELCYPLPSDPGSITTLGVVDYLINLVAPYFQSTLVFRNMMFEVSP